MCIRDSLRTFSIKVMIGEEELGWGKGKSKKEAEEKAAIEALESLVQDNHSVNSSSA